MLSIFRAFVASPDPKEPSPVSSPRLSWRKSSNGRASFFKETLPEPSPSVEIMSITDTYVRPVKSPVGSPRRTITSVVTRDMRSSSDSCVLAPMTAEGTFAFLPDEMRLCIYRVWAVQGDWKTLAIASRVNHRWNREITEVWRREFESRSRDDVAFTTDETLWAKLGKPWKWVCLLMTTPIETPTKTLVYQLGFNANKKSEAEESVKFDGVYEGEWKNGMRHGVGRLWWTDDDRYIGSWKDDKKNGQGMMVWSNGDQYNGGWRDDLRHGSDCKYKYAVGGVFRGTYNHDERHGPGVYEWSDGDKFVGEWKFGGRHGKGIFITNDGTRIVQFWQEDNGVSYSQRQPFKFPSDSLPNSI